MENVAINLIFSGNIKNENPSRVKHLTNSMSALDFGSRLLRMEGFKIIQDVQSSVSERKKVH